MQQLTWSVNYGIYGPAQDLIYSLSTAITGTGPKGPTYPFGPTGPWS
jgi:hypothetical protein